MVSGIRAEVKIDASGVCPVAAASSAGAKGRVIGRSAGNEGSVTVEFLLDDDPAWEAVDVDLDHVFTYGDERAYRFQRPLDGDCPCDLVERFGCAVVAERTHDGFLTLTFHAPDVETLQDVVGELRASYARCTIEQLLKDSDSTAVRDRVFVDRNTLTSRQREVLETAFEMGYFEHPKRANATEVAASLEVSRATFSEHLAAAQRKVLDGLLTDVER